MSEPTLEQRIEAIEARQRDYDMHDPDCAARKIERAQRGTGMYLIPQPCDCWLDDV